jgi:hypothetical protein
MSLGQMPDIFTVISPSGILIDLETLRQIAKDLQAGKIAKGEIPLQKERDPGD